MEERHLFLELPELDLLRQLASSEWSEIAVQQGIDIENHSVIRISGSNQITFSTDWKEGFHQDHTLLSISGEKFEATWQATLQSEKLPVPWRVVWNIDGPQMTDIWTVRHLAVTLPRSLQLLRSCFDHEGFGRVYIHDGVMFQSGYSRLLVTQGSGDYGDLRLYSSRQSIAEYMGLPGYIERKLEDIS